jgi:hypothetical protein
VEEAGGKLVPLPHRKAMAAAAASSAAGVALLPADEDTHYRLLGSRTLRHLETLTNNLFVLEDNSVKDDSCLSPMHDDCLCATHDGCVRVVNRDMQYFLAASFLLRRHMRLYEPLERWYVSNPSDYMSAYNIMVAHDVSMGFDWTDRNLLRFPSWTKATALCSSSSPTCLAFFHVFFLVLAGI